jgi:putative MATE family efflux protein
MLTAVVSVILTVLSLLFLKPLCVLFGATDTIMPYALEYGYIIVFGFPFYAFSMGFNSVLRADGSPVYAMMATLSGAILNMILDPIFIFVFKMGVSGAAIATVMGQVFSCIITLLYLKKFKCILLTKDCLIIQGSICTKVCSLGISSFVMQLAATIVITVMNNVLVKYGAVSKYGSEIPMTTLGITMKVNQIITGIVIGIAVGSQPIIGYNYGAGKMNRVRKTYLLAITCGTIVMGIGTILFQLFPHAIIGIFGSESALYNEFAVKCLTIFLLLIVLNGFQLCTGIFFQAIGKPVQATLISLSRQVLFLLPALLILPRFLGVEGALWAGPVGDACAFVLALIFGIIELRRIKQIK